MEHPAIFSATLGLSHPWHVTSVALASDERRLDITVDYAAGSFPCPHCGSERPWHSSESETWVHGDFFRYLTYLHARVPLVERCPCGTEVPVRRPWSRAGSRFRLVGDQETG